MQSANKKVNYEGICMYEKPTGWLISRVSEFTEVIPKANCIEVLTIKFCDR